ncbi:hypothetical protein HK405_003657 [Cladochytrium tenue]|nr:hypothetical protein HK405_003657 [Cladochytrium tenue]
MAAYIQAQKILQQHAQQQQQQQQQQHRLSQPQVVQLQQLQQVQQLQQFQQIQHMHQYSNALHNPAAAPTPASRAYVKQAPRLPAYPAQQAQYVSQQPSAYNGGHYAPQHARPQVASIRARPVGIMN